MDLKVLQVITTSNLGGAQEVVLGLLEELPAWGVQPVLAVGGDDYLVQRARKLGVQVYPLRHLIRPVHPLADLLAITELRSIIRTVSPQVLHGHSFKAGLFTRILGPRLGIPSVFTVHGWWLYHRLPSPLRPGYTLLERTLAPGVHTVYGSEADLSWARAMHICGTSSLIPNGVRDRGMRRDAPLAPMRGGPLELLVVARLVDAKDPLRTLRILQTIHNAWPEGRWRLTWVGDGPLLAAARNAAASGGIQDRVDFVGRQEDVAPFYQRAHVLLHLSRYEVRPLAVMEAMQARLLIVAPAVGGIGELLHGGKAGILLPAGASEEAWAHKILELLQNPDSWDLMRERAGVEGDAYSARTTSKKYADLYRSLLPVPGSA